MQLDIITADKNLFSGEADMVNLPGSKGQFQVLNNHAALVSSLEKGTILVKTHNETQSFEIEGGFVEVLKNKVIVLV